MSGRLARAACLIFVALARPALAQWTPADGHTLAGLRGLAVVGDSIIWASGERGTVLVSTDLAQHWRSRAVPAAAASDFRGVVGFGARTACAMVAAQDTARIYRTTDSGAAWTLRYDNTRRGAFLDGVAAWDARRGLAIGDPIAGHFLVLTTDDACGHWSDIHPDRLPPALPGEAIFAASNTALVTQRGGRAWIATGGGARARVLRTTDYGVTWRVSDVPLVAGNDHSGAFALAFRADGRGVVVGGDYAASGERRANVAVTADGGATWTAGDTAHQVPFLSGVAYAVADGTPFVVGVGPRGTYGSFDDGLTWTAIDSVGYNAVAAIGSSRLVAVGAAGRIAFASVEALAAAVRGASRVAAFTHADTLRGSITPARGWWDVAFYDLHVAIAPADRSIRGWNGITYRVVGPAQRELQIDLQVPLEIDSVVQEGTRLAYRRDGNAFFVTLVAPQPLGAERTVTVYYHGTPRVARHPPWDGGLIWARDSLGRPWIATANQGVGASVWWPNKDTQAAEPDSQRIAITVPDSLVDVSNGRLRGTTHHADGTTTYEWFVRNPINNYDVAINAGPYVHDSAVYHGEQGDLTLDFWPLAPHADTARKQFAQVSSMLRCFEGWFGPFPWYDDGYKLVETPYLGMEHQSAIAYGNRYKNGYLGGDLSGTGWGLRWDFIIVHESAHEWFGNSITTADIADMWVHESFANYAEALYTECQFGPRAGAEYVIGSRKRVVNDEPVVAPYGVHAEGSGDMYYKGASMLHTIRQIIGNDSTWRSILRGLNSTFRHQIVTGHEIQQYISMHSGIDLSPVFAQYLTTTRIPVLEYAVDGSALAYRWADVVPGFAMPVRITVASHRSLLLVPQTTWQVMVVPGGDPLDVEVDENFYVTARRVAASDAR
jgi:photosystem II stability/assembly factor-like uncharacterized protein